MAMTTQDAAMTATARQDAPAAREDDASRVERTL